MFTIVPAANGSVVLSSKAERGFDPAARMLTVNAVEVAFTDVLAGLEQLTVRPAGPGCKVDGSDIVFTTCPLASAVAGADATDGDWAAASDATHERPGTVLLVSVNRLPAAAALSAAIIVTLREPVLTMTTL
jgi:hypothetical protein